MTEINAKIIIQDDIADLLNISDVEMDGQIESWIERNLNLDDEISDWMGQYFDIDDYLGNVNWGDYIDLDDDHESTARRLLRSYNPLNDCETARAFTEAVGLAVRSFLHDDKNVEYIVKAIDRYNKHKSAEELAESLKEKHYDQFKRELEQYAKTVEANKIDQYNPFIQNHAE